MSETPTPQPDKRSTVERLIEGLKNKTDLGVKIPEKPAEKPVTPPTPTKPSGQ